MPEVSRHAYHTEEDYFLHCGSLFLSGCAAVAATNPFLFESRTKKDTQVLAGLGRPPPKKTRGVTKHLPRNLLIKTSDVLIL